MKNDANEKMAGFSLLEAIVSLALTALVMAAAGSVVNSWLPSWMHGFHRMQSTNTTAIALERLSSDLAAATFAPSSLATPDPLFEGSPTALTFVTRSLNPNSSGGLQVVRWSVAASDGGYRLLRAAAEYSPLYRARQSTVFTQAVLVLRSRDPLKFAYRGENGIQTTRWTSQPQLPTTVITSVATRDHEITTAFYVLARVPIECLGSKNLSACSQPQAAR
jgi:type II secretory pathway component PulJ